jgi:predicted ATPase with chaperone activity
VRAALQNAQFDFPARKITVNLAPAELPKESGRFDLPIALGVLAATGQIPGNALAQYAGQLRDCCRLRPLFGLPRVPPAELLPGLLALLKSAASARPKPPMAGRAQRSD